MSTPEEVQSSTRQPASGDLPTAEMSRGELCVEVADLRARLAVSEARVEFVTQDLKRHRTRMHEWQKLMLDWTNYVTRGAQAVERVAVELMREPDGVPALTFNEAMLGRGFGGLGDGSLLGGLRPTRDKALLSHWEKGAERMPAQVAHLDNPHPLGMYDQ